MALFRCQLLFRKDNLLSVGEQMENKARIRMVTLHYISHKSGVVNFTDENLPTIRKPSKFANVLLARNLTGVGVQHLRRLVVVVHVRRYINRPCKVQRYPVEQRHGISFDERSEHHTYLPLLEYGQLPIQSPANLYWHTCCNSYC